MENRFIYFSITGRKYIVYDGPTNAQDYDFILINPPRTYVNVVGDMGKYITARGWKYKNILPINSFEVADIERIVIFKLYIQKKQTGTCMPNTETYYY